MTEVDPKRIKKVDEYIKNKVSSRHMEQPRLRVQQTDGVDRVEFVDRNILDEANIQNVGQELQRLVDSATTPKILISFSNVDHLSSAALGTLLSIYYEIQKKGGQLILADIDPQVYEIFSIIRINRLFTIVDTTEEGLAMFR